MNLNSERSELTSLHKTYRACVQLKLEKWMNEKTPSEEPEWCAVEKRNYLDHMRNTLPIEYNNLMRMEENNF